MMLLYFYFLPRMAKYTMMPTTASTIKIPKPIPALKIPAIASQELRAKDINSNADTVRKLNFFISLFLKGYLNKYYEKTLPNYY